MDYPTIPNTHPISSTPTAVPSALDPLPATLLSPPRPTPGSKNIFAFWHTGLTTLKPYLLRNILAWHTRFSPLGWTIYVLDNVPSSPLNVAHYIDTTSRDIVPEAFTSGVLSGTYSAQHTSDLIRYPLLLKYGGIYMDVGILQFGDLDQLWTQHVVNPDSRYDFAGFTMGDAPELSIVNFAFMCGKANPLVARAHAILLQVWEGKTNTTGSHAHPLVRHVPLMRVPTEIIMDDEGKSKMEINDESMTDYAIQIQCMGAAQRWVDKEGGWDGPKYVREKAWLVSMMEGAFAHEQLTAWNSARQFELLKLQVPKEGEVESEEQKRAREVVERLVGGSWCLKLSHGVSAKLFGADTLGMLWREHDGSDCGEGTYAAWLRWAEVNLRQVKPVEPMSVPVYEATMEGRLEVHQ